LKAVLSEIAMAKHQSITEGFIMVPFSCFRDAHQRSFSYDRSYQERSSFANDHDRHDKFRFNASFKYDERRDKHRNRFVIFVFKADGFFSLPPESLQSTAKLTCVFVLKRK
jgi:hypothetical protein